MQTTPLKQQSKAREKNNATEEDVEAAATPLEATPEASRKHSEDINKTKSSTKYNKQTTLATPAQQNKRKRARVDEQTTDEEAAKTEVKSTEASNKKAETGEGHKSPIERPQARSEVTPKRVTSGKDLGGAACRSLRNK